MEARDRIDLRKGLSARRDDLATCAPGDHDSADQKRSTVH